MSEPYAPCSVGLHVCGITADEESFYTAANLPTRTVAQARDLFARAKAELSADGDDYDLVVDLCEGPNDTTADFPMNRQMLDRLKAMAAHV